MDRAIGFSSALFPRISSVLSPPFEGGVAFVEIPADDHLRHRRERRPEPLEILRPLLPRLVGAVVDGNGQRHRVLRVVSEVGVRQPQESLARRAGRREHQERQRDLHRNHHAMHAPALHAANHAPSTGLRHAADIRTRQLQRRPDTKRDRGHDGERHAEQQDRHIHLDDRLGRERVRRDPRHDQRKPLPRDQEAQQRASHGNRQRLRQQLLHDAAASGSEGRAHGELLLAMRSTHQQEDRHVRAADEQQRRHRAQQQKEPRAHRPSIELDDAAQRHAKRVGVACGRLPRELLHDGLQLAHSLQPSRRPDGS